MEKPEDIAITPEMLSEIDVEWLRQIDSASGLPETESLDSFQSIQDQWNIPLTLGATPSHMCMDSKSSTSMEESYGELEELVENYHESIREESSSVVDKDFMLDENFRVNEHFFMCSDMVDCNPKSSSDSNIDDLSIFLTSPKVNDAICFTEQNLCETAIDQVDTPKSSSFQDDSFDQVLNTFELYEKSTTEMSEFLDKELDDIALLMRQENESADVVPINESQKSVVFPSQYETPTVNCVDKQTEPMKTHKHISTLTPNCSTSHSQKNNIISLSSLKHLYKCVDFPTTKDSALILKSSSTNNSSHDEQLGVFSVNPSYQECCTNINNIKSCLSMTDSCQTFSPAPIHQSELLSKSPQEDNVGANTLDMVQFENYSCSDPVDFAFSLGKDQCIDESNVSIPTISKSLINDQDYANPSAKFSETRSCQTFHLNRVEKQNDVFSLPESFNREGAEKRSLECFELKLKLHDPEKDPSFVTGFVGMQDPKNVNHDLNAVNELPPGISQRKRNISLLDISFKNNSSMTVKDNITCSKKRKERCASKFNHQQKNISMSLPLPLDKVDQCRHGNEILKSPHYHGSPKSLTVPQISKVDKASSMKYDMTVSITEKRSKASTPSSFNNPSFYRSKSPAKRQESISSLDAEAIPSKVSRLQGQPASVDSSSVKVIKNIHKPSECRCHCVNVGMKNKFVKLRVRDMWNKRVQDLLSLAGHRDNPKNEKEIAKEMKADRNILLERKGKRLQRNN